MSSYTWSISPEYSTTASAYGGQIADDYLNRIYVDGLTVNVNGGYEDENSSAAMSDLHKCALTGRNFSAGSDPRYATVKSLWEGPYMLRLQLPDGSLLWSISINSFQQSAPGIRIRFPASTTRTSGLLDYECRAREIAEWFGFRTDSVDISRLDLSVDIGTTISDLTSGKPAGTFHRRGSSSEWISRATGEVTGEWVKRKKKCAYQPIIYDKRLEVASCDSTFNYAHFWRSIELPDEVPLTRAEIRLFRRGIRKRGVDAVSDLTPEVIESLWQWFTTKYFRFCDGRKINPHWEALSQATCSPTLLG